MAGKAVTALHADTGHQAVRDEDVITQPEDTDVGVTKQGQDPGVPGNTAAVDADATSTGVDGPPSNNGKDEGSIDAERSGDENAHVRDGPAAPDGSDDIGPFSVGMDPGQPTKKKNKKNKRKGGLVGHRNASGFEGKLPS